MAVFVVPVEDGDRHSRSDGSTDRPRGEWGPEPSLPEGRKAEALSQAEEVKRFWRGGNRLFLYFYLQRTDLKSPTQNKISSWVRLGAVRWLPLTGYLSEIALYVNCDLCILYLLASAFKNFYVKILLIRCCCSGVKPMKLNRYRGENVSNKSSLPQLKNRL